MKRPSRTQGEHRLALKSPNPQNLGRPGALTSTSPPAGAHSSAQPPTGHSAADASTQAADTVQAACAQLNCAITNTQVRQLLAYQALLARWNKVYNLTAVRSPEAMLTHHLVDCLAMLPSLQAHLAEVASGQPAVLDVGSGGGLPGVVLAIMQPTWQVHCVDTVAKKVSFIRQVAAELGLPQLKGLHDRVEQITAQPPGYRLITSRAFASLSDFTRLTRHLLAPQGQWVAMKGKRPDEELQSLPADISVFHVEQLNVPGLDADRCLVWMQPYQ